MALEVLKKLPRIDSNDYVFAVAGGKHFNSFSQHKRELDEKLPKDMRPWVLHDLRRTARSLMAKVGVSDEVAERVLGHAIVGVHGIYNRHDYSTQKNAALQKLADQIDMVVNPNKYVENKVVELYAS
jgi:integrase